MFLNLTTQQLMTPSFWNDQCDPPAPQRAWYFFPSTSFLLSQWMKTTAILHTLCRSTLHPSRPFSPCMCTLLFGPSIVYACVELSSMLIYDLKAPHITCLSTLHTTCYHPPLFAIRGWYSNITSRTIKSFVSQHLTMGANKVIGATHAIEGSVDWIALVVIWMKTLGSQPVMSKISPITWTRGLPKP